MTDHYDQNGGRARYRDEQRRLEEASSKEQKRVAPAPVKRDERIASICQDILELRYPEARRLAELVGKHCLNKLDLTAATREEIMNGLLAMAEEQVNDQPAA